VSAEADALARRAAEAMYADDHAARHLGIHIDAVSAGAATLSMLVTDTMVNGHSTPRSRLLRPVRAACASLPTRANA
jgi:acyl-coenzyme A thioesterase PaaI-like protein